MSEKSVNQIESFWKRIVYSDDDRAFERLFYILNPRLIRFCRYYVHQKEAAEEIVSDVFVKCWLQRKNLGHVRNVGTYLYVSVRNQALNYIKRQSRMHMVEIDGQAGDFVDSCRPDTEMEKRELILRLDRAIDSLPHQCRIIFRLVKDDGMKYKEVAAILGISPRTVHTQLFRAMKKLNVVMSPYLQTTEKLLPLIDITLTVITAMFLLSCF